MHIRSIVAAAAVFLLAIFLPVRPSLGWIGTGHKVVAMIAWDDLTPKTREAVIALLRQHPRFEKDLQAGADDDATHDEKVLHIFAQAATWPDMIRALDNPMHAIYHHPAWHYIDIPYMVGDIKTADRPASGPAPHDVVEALTQCVAELKDSSVSGDKKAVDLCWIEHLVGDIHQPLHAVSLYSVQFPKGDQGGNAETVLRDPPYPDSRANLHLIWDSLPGDFMSEEMDRFEARGLRADAKYSREKLKDLLSVTDFMAWAKESHELAVKDAYLNGQLHTVATKSLHNSGGGNGGESIPGLPPDYVKNAEKVAMQQVTLGGYRLADLLNSIFDAK